MKNNIDIIPERNVNKTKGMGRCSQTDFEAMVRNNCSVRIVFVNGKAEIIPTGNGSNKHHNGGGNE